MPRIALLLCVLWPATAVGEYRVVVQEAQAARPMQATPDGKLAWVAAGIGEHVLVVIDLAGPAVLRQFYLPSRIEFASVDSASRKVVVSTRSSIFLGNLTDDALAEILPGASGAVLLQEKARLLAILGEIPEPKAKLAGSWLRNERTLAVYDLEKKAWRFKQRTPIVAPFLESDRYEGPPALLFHEGAVLAAGIGGNLTSMIPVTFSTDVHLDLATGKARVTTGPRHRFGRPVPPVKDRVAEEEPPTEYEGADLKRDEKYAYPAPLVKARDSLSEAIKRLDAEKLLERLSLGETHVRRAQPMPFAIEADGARIALRRYVRVAGAFGAHSAVLSLTSEGKLDLGPTRNVSSNPYGRGSLLQMRLNYPGADLSDLITGAKLLPDAVRDAKGDKDVEFLPNGTLIQDATNLSYFRPGRDRPEWSRRKPAHKWHATMLDQKGQSLALLCGGEPILAEVLRLSDGEVVGTVPRPKDMTDNYMSMALSRDGNRLGIMKREELRVFDVRSGKMLESHAVLEDTHGRGLQSWSGGWLVSSEARCQVFDDRAGKWTTIIPFRSVINLEEVDSPKGKRFVLQNYNGECCLANPADGSVLSQWIASEYGMHRAPLWNAVFAGGKAMLRPTGWIPALEVVDLRDASVVLTIHSIPVGKDLGYIVHTPDGWWDATPGATPHVAVFHKGARLDEEARNARRNGKLIQERLAGLWR